MYLFTTDMQALLLGMQEPSDFLFTSLVIVISLNSSFYLNSPLHKKKKQFMESFIILGGDYFALR